VAIGSPVPISVLLRPTQLQHAARTPASETARFRRIATARAPHWLGPHSPHGDEAASPLPDQQVKRVIAPGPQFQRWAAVGIPPALLMSPTVPGPEATPALAGCLPRATASPHQGALSSSSIQNAAQR